MSAVVDIQASLIAGIRTLLNLPAGAVVFEPEEQQQNAFNVAIRWDGGEAGYSEGEPLIGTDSDAYTDDFLISVFRGDADNAQLLNDSQRLAHWLNYDWTPPSAVLARHVTRRELLRAYQGEAARRSGVRASELTLEVRYVED